MADQQNLFDADRLRDEMTRELLASHPFRRQMAVAEFPMKVSSMACDLKRILTLATVCGETMCGNELPQSTADYIERRILECFRETFGRELFDGKAE